MNPPQSRLPNGFTVRLNRRTRFAGAGRELIGGSPTRVLYLSEAASKMIEGRTAVVTSTGTGLLVDRLLQAAMADPVLESLTEVDTDSVTVVVPVFGRPHALARLLKSIGQAYRVIVVDDCSPDPAAISAVVHEHAAELVCLPRNAGPAQARNEGLRRVTTPYVAFADSDVVVAPNTISLLLKHFNDQRVALVGPRIYGLDNGIGMNWIERYEEARSSLDLGKHPAPVRPRSPVSWLPGAFLVGRVDALGDGFRDGSRVGEDVDLVWRLAQEGWRVRFEPEARVWHEHRQSLGEWLSRKAFYGTSAHPLSLQHPEAVAPAVFAPWSAAVMAVLLCQRSWSLPVAGVICAGAAWRISRKLSRSSRPNRIAISLTLRAVMGSLTQVMALLVRHWWPVAVGGSLVSGRLRRALVLSCVADAAWEYCRTRPQLDPLRFALARRIDDLAYGTGVWLGAVKGRSARCLLPDIRRNPN
ncbi:mycofactocin biosynthesis glycosyltransferase MftF [Arthrobacter sp. FW305-BF8]|uniref:mycofactocin biosynthesis glycosyltransferase MftF n=1 Tax=Arthrobacter sp. FW305-BF8 TaxID=2879617 RepID=UPI001EEF28D2|nr:mycofactocin biosynthesis glycosyltransferase MftF [Arthrobacter sp. FW305-BF8]UKA55229.1 mycofactocin biosynthesis glycosyltransferase MftF [Arthrobacter sp. FW305-BF8]